MSVGKMRVGEMSVGKMGVGKMIVQASWPENIYRFVLPPYALENTRTKT